MARTKTSIGDYCPKVKSPHPGTFRLPKVLAVRRWESPRKVFLYLYAVSDQDGLFELNANQIAEQTGLSRKTVYKAISFLQRVRLLFVEEARTGRGRHSLYRLTWRKRGLPNNSTRKSVTPGSIKDVKSTHSKDASTSKGVGQSRCSTEDYQGDDALKIKLLCGARFYRHVMRAIRLGLEEWALSESVRDALEGFFGLRIDGASLSYARELKGKIWAMRAEIERLAREGASPRRICSFIAGKLTGVPDRRSKREVLRRTAQLLRDVESLERRIAGLKTWLKEREREYHEGRVCARCGYVHSKSEYHSGYRDDGAGLVCFGFARVRLEELQEQRKLRAHTECCRVCGGSLHGGHVDGVCWSCHDRDQAQGRIACRPVLVSELVAATLEKYRAKRAAIAVWKREGYLSTLC